MPVTADPTADIQAALDTYMAAFPNAPPIAWENTPYVPSEGTPYFATRTQGRSQTVTGPGADAVVEHDWVYQVSVFFPANEGLQPALSQAKAVAQYFKRGTSLAVAGGGNLVVELTRIPPSVESGNWINVPVQVSCFYYQN